MPGVGTDRGRATWQRLSGLLAHEEPNTRLHPLTDKSSDTATVRLFGLDLVRALAIVLVLVDHCGSVFANWYGTTPPLAVSYCGTFGVEIFFVLSGYLVGRILLQTEPGMAAWRRFLIRRWLRTVPLYYVILAALFCIWPPEFWRPDHTGILLRAVPEYAFFLQNFAWSVGHNNWFGASWSLTVEEWFYLGFSAMVVGLSARLGRKLALFAAIAVFLIGPAIIRGLATPDHAAPHSVVTAVDQICIGVLLAMYSLWAPSRFAALTRALPLGAALCALFWSNQLWIAAPVRQALWTDVLGAGVALCLPAAIAWRQASGVIAYGIRAISVRSYGLYLIHLPVLELTSFYRTRLPLPVWCQVAAASAVIIVLPALSWRYLEQPLLYRRGRQMHEPVARDIQRQAA